MIKAVISWIFTKDRLKNEKYLPVYYNQMFKSPVVYEHLNNGGMSVQLGTQTHSYVYLVITQLRKEQTKTHLQQGRERKCGL